MEQQLTAIINSLDDAIVCVDEAQRTVFLNQPAARLFHCEPVKAVGQPLAHCPALAEFWAKLKVNEVLLSSGGPRLIRRLEYRRPDGENLLLEVSLACAEANGVKLVTGVFRDISWQQQMENALHQARSDQALDGLAGRVAHDFNNVLTAVISQLDLAIQSSDCPASLKPKLNQAQISARRGAEIVARLQMPSRQTHAKPAPPPPDKTASTAAARETFHTEQNRLEGREWILVADDDEAVRTVIRAVLEYRRYHVVEACDGEDAIRKYLESPNRFDLVLMDRHMPRLNGCDAVVKIRQHDPKARIVLLSGTVQELKEGARGEIEKVRFLPKPFQNQELVELVREMLDAK